MLFMLVLVRCVCLFVVGFVWFDCGVVLFGLLFFVVWLVVLLFVCACCYVAYYVCLWVVVVVFFVLFGTLAFEKQTQNNKPTIKPNKTSIIPEHEAYTHNDTQHQAIN